MKKKLLKSLGVIFISFSLLSCKDNKEDKPTKGEVDVVVPAFFTESKRGAEVSIHYEDDYFKKSASNYSNSLMNLSFGAALASSRDINPYSFYQNMGYDNIVMKIDDVNIEENKIIDYMFAHKEIDDFHLFAVTGCGVDYLQEWASNFEVGREGDHVGFYTSAIKMYEALKGYINAYKDNKPYKIWLSGYSRGGSIANVLSYILMESEEINVNEDNLYTYTFNTSRGLIKEHAKKYRNVFNVINTGDLISLLLPEKYGLYRCGNDIELNSDHLEEYLQDIGSKMTVEPFTETDDYHNEKEFVEYLVNNVFLKEYTIDKDHPYSIFDREHFMEVQASFMYALTKVLYSSKSASDVINTFKGLNQIQILALIGGDGSQIYNLLTPIFDKNSVPYEQDALMKVCSDATSLIKGMLSSLKPLLGNSNLIRALKIHSSETTCCFVKHYQG